LARQSGVWRSRVMRGFVRFGGARQGKAHKKIPPIDGRELQGGG